MVVNDASGRSEEARGGADVGSEKRSAQAKRSEERDWSNIVTDCEGKCREG